MVDFLLRNVLGGCADWLGRGGAVVWGTRYIPYKKTLATEGTELAEINLALLLLPYCRYCEK